MKKIFFYMCLLVTSLKSFASEDLSLACIGEHSSQFAKFGGGFSLFTEKNSSESFIFKNGTLIKKLGNINCKWSDESITCKELGKKFGDGTLHRNIHINRITGAVQSHEIHNDKNDNALILIEFFGSCKSQKKKF